MNTQILKIDPKEFGLEDQQVQTIEQAFAPKIAERDGLVEIYKSVISKELTPELCSEAKQVRLKLVKVRTGIADIHRTQKAFFLAAGRFVDAWKNKETEPVEQMESNLKEIEEHFINLEKQRKAQLEIERTQQLHQYTEIMPVGLADMQQDVFDAYLNAQKTAHEARIEAERKAEADRIAREKAEAEERERIRKENEQLKKEAGERERKAEDERKTHQDEFEKQRKESEAKQKAIEDAARIEREKAEAERAKLQAELKAKADAEAKAKAEQERIEREKAKAMLDAAKAPDKIKLQRLVEGIVFPEIPQLTTDDSRRVASDLLQKFEAYKKWAVSQITQI